METRPAETSNTQPAAVPSAVSAGSDRRDGEDLEALAAYARMASARRGLTVGELAEDLDDNVFAIAGPLDALPFLQALVAPFAGASRRVHVACDTGLRLPAAELAALGIIASEAIRNALTHAFPVGRDGDVWLRLVAERGRITLTVRDNGMGMPDLDHAPDSGRGLIEALARHFGGQARLGSTTFGGAEVQAVFRTAAATHPA